MVGLVRNIYSGRKCGGGGGSVQVRGGGGVEVGSDRRELKTWDIT